MQRCPARDRGGGRVEELASRSRPGIFAVLAGENYLTIDVDFGFVKRTWCKGCMRHALMTEWRFCLLG